MSFRMISRNKKPATKTIFAFRSEEAQNENSQPPTYPNLGYKFDLVG
nr:hypothetical protein [Vibrio cholerae O139]